MSILLAQIQTILMEENLKYCLYFSSDTKAKGNSNYDLIFKTLSEEGVRYNMQKHPMFY